MFTHPFNRWHIGSQLALTILLLPSKYTSSGSVYKFEYPHPLYQCPELDGKRQAANADLVSDYLPTGNRDKASPMPNSRQV
ncbi:hypothetical protein F4678DRAFT_423015 [Xylaria arbuscula]|nr:hypothetical protein F4678DRAFT_423015 [Xylaria arbuscula]